MLVAISTDYIIFRIIKELGISYQTNTMFGLLVIIWLILNELLSILENAGRMGVNLPSFLIKVLSEIQSDIEDKKSYSFINMIYNKSLMYEFSRKNFPILYL